MAAVVSDVVARTGTPSSLPGAGDGNSVTRRARRWIVACNVLYVAAALPTLRSWTGKQQWWRQAQTADTARIFHRTGIDLFHPQLSVFGPNTVLGFELPWYQAISALIMRLGVPDLVALRVVAMLFTLITSAGVAALARRAMGANAAAWAVGIFLLNPFTMLWGRVGLIESFTTAAVLWWIVTAWRAVDRWPQSRRASTGWLSVSVLLGAVASTSKMTTFLPWAMVLIAVIRPVQIWRAVICGVAFGPATLAGLVWTRFADASKEDNPLTAWLTSKAVNPIAVRPLGDRLNGVYLLRIAIRVPLYAGGLGLILAAVGLIAMVRGRQALVGVALAAVPVVAMGVFFGLYLVHDYYQFAITPAVCLLMGVGANQLAGSLRRRPTMAVGALAVHLLGFWLVSGERYGRTVDEMPAAIADLQRSTSADEQVVGVTLSYDPFPFFVADRHGTLITDMALIDHMHTVLDTTLGSPRVLWADKEHDARTEQFLEPFSRLAAVGTHTYRFGDSVQELERGPSGPALSWEAADGGVAGDASTALRVPCTGRAVTLGSPASAFTVATDHTVWFGIGTGVAELPIRSGHLAADKPVVSVSCAPADEDSPRSSVLLTVER